MDQSDFDELMHGARQFVTHLASAYREITGEELDIESAVRHYPLVALGIAAGVGAFGGWWFGRRGQIQLPPPTPEPSPLNYVERFIPEGLEKVRDLLPESIAEEATAQARTWVEDVLEPRLREGVESAVSNIAETRWGAFLKETIQRFETGPEKELDDPE